MRDDATDTGRPGATRRQALRLSAALALAPAGAALAAVTPVPADGPIGDLHAAWRRLFGAADGQVFAWWMSGVMTAHVDGLREFPVMESHALMICRMRAASSAETRVDWRTIGYFADLDTGLPAERWRNVFTGRTEAVPSRFSREGGRYEVKAGAEGASLTVTEADTRMVRAVLSGVLAEGRAIVEQSESRIQGFAQMNGSLPALTSPAVTEVQTRLSFVAPAADLAKGNGPLPGFGYFQQVYDGLPPWLGFGERLGGTPVKGSMRKAAADEVVDPAVWGHLQRLFPAAFSGGRLVLG